MANRYWNDEAPLYPHLENKRSRDLRADIGRALDHVQDDVDAIGGGGRAGARLNLGEDPAAISSAQVDAAEIFVVKSTSAGTPATHPETTCATAETYDLGAVTPGTVPELTAPDAGDYAFGPAPFYQLNLSLAGLPPTPIMLTGGTRTAHEVALDVSAGLLGSGYTAVDVGEHLVIRGEHTGSAYSIEVDGASSSPEVLAALGWIGGEESAGTDSITTTWTLTLAEPSATIFVSNADPGFVDPEAVSAMELAAVLEAYAVGNLIPVAFTAPAHAIICTGTGAGGSGEVIRFETTGEPTDLSTLLSFDDDPHFGEDGEPGLTVTIADPTTPATSKGFPLCVVNDDTSAGSIQLEGTGISGEVSAGQVSHYHWGTNQWCIG